MSDIKTLNNRIGCKEVKEDYDPKQQKPGIITSSRSLRLIRAEVVLDSSDGKFLKGEVVYFRPDVMNHSWTKESFQMETDEGNITVTFLDSSFVVAKAGVKEKVKEYKEEFISDQGIEDFYQYIKSGRKP